MDYRQDDNPPSSANFPIISSDVAPSKHPKPSTHPVDTNSVTLRLQKELTSLMMSGDIGVSAFPMDENIFSWIGTIQGIKGTPYEGLTYKLSMQFPLDYPFKPPQVKFENKCFHPNVDKRGNICLDILQNMWTSAYDCKAVLLSIQSLLGGEMNLTPKVLSTLMRRRCGATKKITRKWFSKNTQTL